MFAASRKTVRVDFQCAIKPAPRFETIQDDFNSADLDCRAGHAQQPAGAI